MTHADGPTKSYSFCWPMMRDVGHTGGHMKIRHFLYNSFLIENGKNKIAEEFGSK